MRACTSLSGAASLPRAAQAPSCRPGIVRRRRHAALRPCAAGTGEVAKGVPWPVALLPSGAGGRKVSRGESVCVKRRVCVRGRETRQRGEALVGGHFAPSSLAARGEPRAAPRLRVRATRWLCLNQPSLAPHSPTQPDDPRPWTVYTMRFRTAPSRGAAPPPARTLWSCCSTRGATPSCAPCPAWPTRPSKRLKSPPPAKPRAGRAGPGCGDGAAADADALPLRPRF